jgi:uncharacterized damage-inducible protein DinB
MTMIEALLQELEQEAQTTKRVLERVPEGKLTWKPHEKSMSLGQLALHVATTPGGVAEMSQQSPFPVPEFKQPAATSSAEILAALDQSIAKANSVLRGLDDASLGRIWRVVDKDGHEMFALPLGALFRTIMLNHWHHHRGQLSVYLRQVGIPVPSIYGPSADENPFMAPTQEVSA